MAFNLQYNDLVTLPTMCTVAVLMAVGWGAFLEAAKKKIYYALPKALWWRHALEPMKSMMANFGYPKEPTDKFPNGTTDSMVRDSYAFICAILFAHFFSALPMLPVLINGWENSSDMQKSMFVLGTLSDLGFSIYDSANMTYRTFFKHPMPIPFDFWFVMVPLHHTTAMVLVLPMNLYYVHRAEFHQTAVSLLMAAVLCYGAGNYKFSLDIGNKRRDFYMYKCIVMFQLATILYTRVWLWFPSAGSFRNHLKEKNDTVFFYGASVMITLLSLFNIILVIDGFKAAFKCIPKKFPEKKSEKEKTVRAFRRASSTDFPMLASSSVSFYTKED